MKQYLDLLQDILDNGTRKDDRTGTGTLSVFGRQYRHDLSQGFPLLTTKKLHLKSIINELIWFLSGDTNTRWLKENGVSIWDEWATPEGDLGPLYGAQWTAWPTRDGGSINQIDYVVDCLRNNPDSRRILFHGWNVEYLPDEGISPQDNGPLRCLPALRWTSSMSPVDACPPSFISVQATLSWAFLTIPPALPRLL